MINESLVFIDETLDSQVSIINKIADVAYELGFISNKNGYIEGVLEREKDMPTSVGFDVAMPHCRSNAVIKPFVAFVRTNASFVWDSRNNELVNLVFAIGVPQANEGNLHLKYISSISRKLINESFRNELKNAQTKEQAFDILKSIGE